MKKRIRQLARGQFDSSRTQIVLPQEPVTFTVAEGKDYEGSFRISCTGGKTIRGMVYCLDSRIECITSRFDGDQVEIRFRFHGKGLPDGTRHQGRFELVCSRQTAQVPFVAEISRSCYEASTGRIRNLNDFTRLAQENWKEAYRLFYNPGFPGIFAPEEKRERLLYRAMTEAYPSHQNMEEFLIGTGRKRKILFTAEREEIRIWEAAEAGEQEIRIRKDGWGYLRLQITADAPFIRLKSEEISSPQFAGSDAVIGFTADPAAMHAGRNFGRILIRSPYQTVTVSVMASLQTRAEGEEGRYSVRRDLKRRLMSGCLTWKLKRKPTGVWASESVELLRQLYLLEPDCPEYLLMKAYCFLCNRQRHELEKALEEYAPFAEAAEKEYQALYRYMKDQLDRKKREETEDDVLALCMLSMDSDLSLVVARMVSQDKNDADYLREIGQRIEARVVSPWMMLEASLLVLGEPQLLTGVNGYQQKLLMWILRHHAMSAPLAARVLQLVDFARGYEEQLYRVLCACWDLVPKKDSTAAICRYLIRGGCYEPRYLEWYERAINDGQKITRLYEAYLMSMDNMDVTKIPRSMQMYFQYDTPLPYQKLAVMYCNIIAWKERDPDLYHRYQRAIGRFALDQVEQKHMDDNLALIYTDMLPPAIMNEKMAHDLANVLFTCKIGVTDPSVVKVLVYHWQLRDPLEVPVKDGCAFVPVYSDASVVVLEDSYGCRFSGSLYYHAERLMDPELYVEKARQLAPTEIPYIIVMLDNVKDYRSFREEDRKCFDRFLLREDVSARYKAQMEPEILKFYQGQEQDQEKLKRYLTIADYELLTPPDRKFVTELMAANGMTDLAWERLQEYGPECMDPFMRSKVLEAQIRKLEGEPDSLLAAMTAQTMAENAYNAAMVQYLAEVYVGPAEIMELIWRLGVYYKIPVNELAERILVTILYSDLYLQNELRIFTEYVRQGGQELVIEAFLSARSQAYFMEDHPMDPALFDLIRIRYGKEKEISDACRLALLKYYSECSSLDPRQKLAADLLLGELVGRDMYFAFFRKLPADLLRKYHLEGEVFLEYHTIPGRQVTVYLSRDEDGQNFYPEDMHEVYYGIYVKSFVLFFGELIRYYIKEETSETVTMQQTSRLMPDDCVSTWPDGRYQMLNQILMSRSLREDEQMKADLIRYQENEVLAASLFSALS